MYRVKEVSELTGISVRMLHHYDKIGLLRPTAISESGYRLYNYNDLKLIQQILIYRELDFSLKEIKEILSNENLDLKETLRIQKQFIIDKRNRLNKIVETIENTIKDMEGKFNMNKKGLFEGFDIEKHNKLYEEEVENKYGKSDAYKESKEKTSKYSKEDWNNIMGEIDDLYKNLAELMDRDV